ncbi:hypothetical protein Poli38472_003170 [Pythium oligandrum]|uniref:Cell death regulator Aven n=1 Tax=Pythium oligandrum TaxID=41045 RepID=A0A8K1C6I4_PYTOL|nr:hypothetical protein Poli38472_003170 [Pythium oligandrum]|eukprot:TMW57245.1 hypothetical protein Poli38472_003170 [Pythium oligandrum]
MGRSNLKYRSTRGRGHGESTRGKGRSHTGGRPLESNAHRFEEREVVEEEEGEEAVIADSSMRRQFFAEEKQYRDAAPTKDSYFRSRAVQEWEAEEEEDVGASNVGVMDFAWIATQLTSVPLSVRYEIDPKYCVDFEVDEPLSSPSAPEDVTYEVSNTTTVVNEVSATASDAARVGDAGDRALDELLALSQSAPTQQSSTTAAKPTEPAPSSAHEESENLEDWLDDVLDM